MSPVLRLNETSLLFIPQFQETPATIVQVTVTTKRNESLSVEVLARYYIFQYQISELVAKVLAMHSEHPLPNKSLFTGDGYVLLAERKEWKLGQRWQFAWGDEEIKPAKDKWVFTYMVNNMEI